MKKNGVSKIVYILTYPIRIVLLGLIYFYKLCISPLFPNSCRFTPTCSTYCLIALKEYGIIKGLGLTVWRIMRCNPFNKNCGYDPVKDNIKGNIKWIL